MALTINPAFDFGVDDIPTRDLLVRQAKSLAISGIDIGTVSGTLIGIVSADDSGLSGGIPPDMGWLWVDRQGHRFVGGARHDARMWSAHGGWESGRHHYNSFDPAQFGIAGHGVGVAGVELEEIRLDMDVGNLYTHVLADNRQTQATSARLIFRGAGELRTDSRATLALFANRGPGTRHISSGTSVWDVFNTRDGAYGAFTSYLYSDAFNHSGATSKTWGWITGVAQKGSFSLAP